MGLFSKRIKNGVRGQAHVVSTTGLSDHTAVQRCKLNLVVRAEGIAPYSLEHSCFAKARHFPYPGMVLPVLVDPKRTDRIKIVWDEVPDHGSVARSQSEAIAAQMRGAPPSTSGGSNAGLPPETAQIVDQLRGTFPGATVEVAGGGAAPGGPPGGEGQVARLERLAALHQSGALSDAEFTAAKRRVLDDLS